MRTVFERLLMRVDKTEDCWLWTGALDGWGYGLIATEWGRHPDGKRWCKSRRTHLVSYEQHVGPIPAGLTLDHLCRVRNCVRPSHLEPVPGGVNTLRGEGPTALNARKTHCIRGHPLTGDNLVSRKNQRYRQCRTCANDGARRRKREKVAA